MPRAGETTLEPTERGRPLRDYLVKTFGGIGKAARKGGIVESTLRRAIYEQSDSISRALIDGLKALGVPKDVLEAFTL